MGGERAGGGRAAAAATAAAAGQAQRRQHRWEAPTASHSGGARCTAAPLLPAAPGTQAHGSTPPRHSFAATIPPRGRMTHASVSRTRGRCRWPLHQETTQGSFRDCTCRFWRQRPQPRRVRRLARHGSAATPPSRASTTGTTGARSRGHMGCMRRWLRRRWQLGPQPEPAPGQLAARARRHGHLARSYERLGNETVLTHTALLTRLHATESHARARTNANA